MERRLSARGFLQLALSVSLLAAASVAQAAESFSSRVASIAGRSACASYSWKSRGRAPLGYTKGVALSFARGLCRLRASMPESGPGSVMSAASSGNSAKDVLAHYHSTLSAWPTAHRS